MAAMAGALVRAGRASALRGSLSPLRAARALLGKGRAAGSSEQKGCHSEGRGCASVAAAMAAGRLSGFPPPQRRLHREGPGRGPVAGMGILNSVPCRRGA